MLRLISYHPESMPIENASGTQSYNHYILLFENNQTPICSSYNLTHLIHSQKGLFLDANSLEIADNNKYENRAFNSC